MTQYSQSSGGGGGRAGSKAAGGGAMTKAQAKAAFTQTKEGRAMGALALGGPFSRNAGKGAELNRVMRANRERA